MLHNITFIQKCSPGSDTQSNSLVFCHPNHVILIMLHTQTGLQDYNLLWNLESVLKTNMKRICEKSISVYAWDTYHVKVKAFQQTQSSFNIKSLSGILSSTLIKNIHKCRFCERTVVRLWPHCECSELIWKVSSDPGEAAGDNAAVAVQMCWRVCFVWCFFPPIPNYK